MCRLSSVDTRCIRSHFSVLTRLALVHSTVVCVPKPYIYDLELLQGMLCKQSARVLAHINNVDDVSTCEIAIDWRVAAPLQKDGGIWVAPIPLRTTRSQSVREGLGKQSRRADAVLLRRASRGSGLCMAPCAAIECPARVQPQQALIICYDGSVKRRVIVSARPVPDKLDQGILHANPMYVDSAKAVVGEADSMVVASPRHHRTALVGGEDPTELLVSSRPVLGVGDTRYIRWDGTADVVAELEPVVLRGHQEIRCRDRRQTVHSHDAAPAFAPLAPLARAASPKVTDVRERHKVPELIPEGRLTARPHWLGVLNHKGVEHAHDIDLLRCITEHTTHIVEMDHRATRPSGGSAEEEEVLLMMTAKATTYQVGEGGLHDLCASKLHAEAFGVPYPAVSPAEWEEGNAGAPEKFRGRAQDSRCFHCTCPRYRAAQAAVAPGGAAVDASCFVIAEPTAAEIDKPLIGTVVSCAPVVCRWASITA